MNQPSKRRRPDRRTPARRPKSFDPWRTPARMPDFEPIRTHDDATALLRSLGDPPIAGGARLAGYFGAVVERAASVATALCLSVELPAVPPETTSDPSDSRHAGADDLLAHGDPNGSSAAPQPPAAPPRG